ncbi:MAG TPA: ABC transporter permease [Bacteroidia bacterium]|jgi:ABC-2 type transport system permease protein|nr:ABC transporter permease [Bacteroidia bacterium]
MFKIVRKELLTFIKDRRALLLTFIVPITLISLFALAFGGTGGGSVRPISILVVDEDKSATSKDILSSLDSVKMLKPVYTTGDSALTLITTGKMSAALVFHKGFGDSVKNMRSLPWELEYDEAQAQEMGMLQQYLGQSLFGKVGKMMTEKMIRTNIDKQFGGMMDSNMKASVLAQVNKNVSGTNNDMDKMKNNTMKLKMTSVVKSAQDSPGLVQAVAGTAVMMLLFGLTAMGGRILEEKENGTLKRLMYSPLHTNEILMGKMLTSIIVAFAQLMVMLTFASFVFGLHLWSKLPQVFILVTATAFACSGFGVFLASVVKSRDQLQGLSTLVVLSMSAIGGSMIPTFIMPEWMQKVSPFSINYWSIQGFFDIFWRQLPMGTVFFEKVGILMIIGSVLSILAFRFFRKNAMSMA